MHGMIMKIRFISKIMAFMTAVFCLVSVAGCSVDAVGSFKKAIPENKYDRIGYAVDTEISGEKVNIVYAVVGYKGDKMVYLDLDEIEKTLGQEKSLSTNKELGSAYGLGYISDLGEWNVQIKALLDYIQGNGMTPEEILAIETYQKDENNPTVPKPDTDLAAACELNIGKYLQVINKACKNTQKIDAMTLGGGEDIKIYNKDKSIVVDFAFLALDYNSKIVLSKLDRYEATFGDTEFSCSTDGNSAWQESIKGYEQYILGLTGGEATGVEVYDKGDGVNTALPKAGTDLAEVCNVDIGSFIKAVREAVNRAW